MSYQTLLHELAPDLNPAGIEASMRLHCGTLNYLPRETFVVEAKLAADLEALAKDMPDLSVGSYPFFEPGNMGASIVARGVDAARLQLAVERIVALVEKQGCNPEIDPDIKG